MYVLLVLIIVLGGQTLWEEESTAYYHYHHRDIKSQLWIFVQEIECVHKIGINLDLEYLGFF
jgi:hypothetical protein